MLKVCLSSGARGVLNADVDGVGDTLDSSKIIAPYAPKPTEEK